MDNSAGKTWYAVGVIVVAIAAIALWYYYSTTLQTADTRSTAGQTQPSPVSSGNTTADISANISQLPDDSAGLSQDVTASVQAVSGF